MQIRHGFTGKACEITVIKITSISVWLHTC